MPENREHIELRSEEVQAIMSHVPTWMIRWGMTLIFGLIALAVFICWMIKYPDVISGRVSLTTTTPPVKLVTRNAGQIEAIHFEEGVQVKKGELIATLNDALTDEARTYLLTFCEDVKYHLQVGTLDSFAIGDTNLIFGSVQQDYLLLGKAILDYQQRLDQENHAFKTDMLKEQIEHRQELKTITERQVRLLRKSVNRAKEKYKADKGLYKKKVLSRNQFLVEENKYLNAKQSLEERKKMVVNHSLALADLKKELYELEYAFGQDHEQAVQKISQLVSGIRNALENWQINYQLTAPVDGKLVFVDNVTRNQHVEMGKELFAVVPDDQDYIGYVEVSQKGYGKVKPGQRVRIQLDNYPEHEYGKLTGTVEKLSVIPNEEKYRVTIRLPEGMKSTYNKDLVFTPEMGGGAEIVTENVRLTDRIFFGFRSVMNQ